MTAKFYNRLNAALEILPAIWADCDTRLDEIKAKPLSKLGQDYCISLKKEAEKLKELQDKIDEILDLITDY